MNRVVPFIAALFICFTLIGQKSPEIIPPYSHNMIISDIEFGNDDKYIYSLGFEGSVMVWDIKTETPIKKIFAHTRECYQLNISHDGSKFLTASIDSTVKIWDTKSLELLHTIHTKDANFSASWSPRDSFIVTGGNSGIVQIYDTKNYKFQGGLVIGKSPVYDAQFFRGNKMLITADQSGHLKLTLKGTGEIGMDVPMEYPLRKIVMDESQSAFAIHGTNGQADIVLVPSMKPFGALKVPKTTLLGDFQFVSEIDINSPTALMAYADNAGRVNISDPITKEMQTVLSGHNSFVSKVKFSRSGKWLASVDHNQKIRLYDLREFNVKTSSYIPIKKLSPTSDYPRKLYFTKDNSIHFTGMGAYEYNLSSGEMRDMHLSENFNIYETSFKKTDFNGYTYRYNEKNGIVLASNKSDTIAIKYEHKAVSKNAEKIVFHHNSKWIYIDVKKNELSTIKVKADPEFIDALYLSISGEFIYSTGTKTKIYNIATKKTAEFNTKLNISDISANENIVLSSYYNELYKIENAKISTIKIPDQQGIHVSHIDKNLVAIYGMDGKLRVFNLDNKKVINTKEISASGMSDMVCSPDGKLLGLVTTDRSVQLYHLENQNLNKVYNIYGLGTEGMLITANNGCYMSTKNAYQNLAFNYNNKVYPLEQFDAMLNQPHKVLIQSPLADQKYVTLYQKAQEKRNRKNKSLDINTASYNNIIEIQGKNTLSSVTKEPVLNLDMKLLNKPKTGESVHIYINDVPLYGIEGTKKSGNSWQEKIELIPGKNRISCLVKDQNGNESLKDYIDIIYETEDQPNLYLVTIGVSEYQDQAFNLNYASKDAEDMNQLLSKSSAYKKVFKKSLLNKDVTQTSITDLKKFLSQAKTSDVVIVFMAGHGTLDESYNYYFAGHNMDFKDPNKNGISFQNIQSLLDGIPCLRKVLLMDTCHSGEVDKEDVVAAENDTEEDSDLTFRSSGNNAITTTDEKKMVSEMASEMFMDTRKSTGTTIISSSGGTEVAREGKEWKNGLFTYCFKLGIESKKADLNRDGKIMLSELREFINERVYTLSHGKQKPTARSLNLSMDYRIF